MSDYVPPDAPTGFCNVYGLFPWLASGNNFSIRFELYGESPAGGNPVLVNTVQGTIINGQLSDCGSTPVNPIEYVQLSRNDGLESGTSSWAVTCDALGWVQLPMTLAAAIFNLESLIP